MTEIIRLVRVFLLFVYFVSSLGLFSGFCLRRKDRPVVAQTYRLYKAELKELRARMEGRSSRTDEFSHHDIKAAAQYFASALSEQKKLVFAHLAGMYVRAYFPISPVGYTDKRVELSEDY